MKYNCQKENYSLNVQKRIVFKGFKSGWQPWHMCLK